jgi:hypothetical protein
VRGKETNEPKRLFKQAIPVPYTGRHGPHMDQVEEVFSPGPQLFCVVDFKLHTKAILSEDADNQIHTTSKHTLTLGGTLQKLLVLTHLSQRSKTRNSPCRLYRAKIRRRHYPTSAKSKNTSEDPYIPVAPGNSSPASIAQIPVPVPISRICCGSTTGVKVTLPPNTRFSEAYLMSNLLLVSSMLLVLRG